VLLYKDHTTAEMAKEVDAQLDKKDISLRELLTKHLEAIKAYARATIIDEPTMLIGREAAESLPFYVFLSVPQMWKPPANFDMTQAARDAGIDYVELVYEPQCAFAQTLSKVNGPSSHQLNNGEVILVADIGSGNG
jgi:molecular chaperone DnaK (HSP70)